jgi:hypothetical protein
MHDELSQFDPMKITNHMREILERLNLARIKAVI